MIPQAYVERVAIGLRRLRLAPPAWRLHCLRAALAVLRSCRLSEETGVPVDNMREEFGGEPVAAFSMSHPAVPALYIVLTLGLTMSSMQPVLIALSLAGGLAYGFATRGAAHTLGALRWQLPVILIIALVNPLFSASGSTELFRIGMRAVYLESMVYGLCMGGLFVASVLWFEAAASMLEYDKVLALLGNAAPAIEVRGLSFAYPDADAAVLEGLDWSVPQGAFALLVGGTGSGKSTLLSLLKPEIAPAGERTGELRVLGENVADMDVRASAERVGYVFQDPENQIVCETVWHEMAFGLENLGVSRDEMRRRVAETSYFFGLEDWLHRDTDTLSGGRKQLLSLTAVLALRPRVLLLDEPTSQLDPVAEKNFLHALFRVNRELGCTVVVATHQPRPMLEYATRAYRIEGGRVREVADMASLGRRESLFSDEMLGWGAIRCAKNGVFSRREDNLGSLEPPGDVSSAKKSSELDKSSEFVAQTSLENGSEAFPRTDGSRILQKMHGGSATTLSEGWFRYDRAGGWVLRGLDVAFSASAVHAIVGGNGCGKSTMLSVLAKTAKLQRGRMVRGAASAALLPQNPKALLVAETVRDELMEWASTCGYDENLARERAAQLGLDGLETRHPYDLSGGQRQLLALAKLLLIGPELLLLDEPTKGLDLESRRIIARALRDHAKAGGTVIMATHDLDFAEQVADDVAMMFDGEIACMEPPADFFADNVFYRA